MLPYADQKKFPGGECGGRCVCGYVPKGYSGLPGGVRGIFSVILLCKFEFSL